ncbi:MAG: hypothetical protein ABEJ95_01335 [Candidatus Nanohalobium sp.]
MAAFESLLQMMIDSGASYVFMWLLFAALIYGLLAKYEVFSESSAAGGVALGASFFTLLGVYAFAPEGLFLNFAASIGFILFGLFGLIILLSISGVDVTEMTEGVEGNIVAGLGIVLFLVAFLGSLAYNLNWSGLLGGVEDTWQDVVFPVLFMVFMLAVIVRTT